MTVARQVSSLAGTLLLASLSLHAQAKQVQYTVEVDAAKSAVFHITMQFTAQPGTLRLAMPASTPGEIDIKNHARYVMRLEAFDQQARSLAVRRFDKQTWLIDVQKSGTVAIHYDVRPNTRDPLRLGTSWLQENGGSIEPASLFLYLSNHLDLPISLRLKLPSPWKVVSTLHSDGKGTFVAADYRRLLDSPLQFGLLEERTITEGNIRCRLVFDAPLPPYDALTFDQNIRKIIRSELQLFGRAPFDEYTVLFHWRPDLDFGGGIEHGKAMIMNIGKKWMLDLPTNMAGTFAHELFHAWNAEAFYPRDFARWDYARENYTSLMWFVEGVTNYYATLTLVRTGILPKEKFYAMMSNTISSYENEPGRGFVSLRESGIAEWIRPIESLDYYAGGEVAGFLLDLEIRRAAPNRSSLDTVMRALYAQSERADYHGYEEQDLVKLVNESAARDLAGFFDLYVRGKGPIDYDRLLRDLGVAVGMKVEQDGKTYSLSPVDSMTTDQRTFWQLLLDSAAQGS